MRTRTKIIILSSLVLSACLLLVGYFALIYIPGWYEPVYVDPADQQKLRDDFTAISAKFNKGMQRPEPFEIAISATDINRFISGVAYLDPRMKDAIPSTVMDPAVQLEDDYLKLGAVVEQDGKRVFASLWLKVYPLANWLILEDLKVKVGMYPVPMEVIISQVEKMSEKFSRILPDLRTILKTGQYLNQFRYPNSDYDFRILYLRAREGTLYITIEPIPRPKK